MAAHADALAHQGVIAASFRRRGGRALGPYYRLTLRQGQVQHSVYLGTDAVLIAEVRAALRKLQETLRERRAVQRQEEGDPQDAGGVPGPVAAGAGAAGPAAEGQRSSRLAYAGAASSGHRRTLWVSGNRADACRQRQANRTAGTRRRVHAVNHGESVHLLWK